MSSWDKYKKEVLSGTLDWSPMHTSEVFWRNNVDKFEDKDFQLLRVLLKLLETNRDPRTQVCVVVVAVEAWLPTVTMWCVLWRQQNQLFAHLGLLFKHLRLPR